MSTFSAAISFSDRQLQRRRLRALQFQSEAQVVEAESHTWNHNYSLLSSLEGKLGQAGFQAPGSQARARLVRMLALLLPVGSGLLWGISLDRPGVAIISALVGLYLGFGGWLLYLRRAKAEYHRQVMFQLPLVLEALILLVEAGLGILPALQRLVEVEEGKYQVPTGGRSGQPVLFIFRLVYQLCAHGMPFSQALETVAQRIELKTLRHVLLHLDISGTEGGELIPSLRSLSDHTHTEWRLSVETRVKRLENLVVFPVFAAVLGLILLTSAVPLVPVLKFRESLREGRTTSAILEPETNSVGSVNNP